DLSSETGQKNLASPIVDDQYVYFVVIGAPNEIRRVLKTGGPTQTITSGIGASEYIVEELAGDLTHIYFTEPAAGRVSRVAKSVGSPVEVLATGQTVTGQTSVAYIAVDETNVYWTISSEKGPSGSVARTAKIGGGPIVPLATQLYNPQGIALDGQYAYWVN